MPPDLEKYRQYVAELDLSESEQDALLQSLWTIMESFADYAWGLHPVQQIPCGQIRQEGLNPALTAPDGVKYEGKIIINDFMKATGPDKDAGCGKNDNATIKNDN